MPAISATWARCSRQSERQIGSLHRGIAQVGEPLPRHIGQEADLDGLLDVDVLAKGSADEHPLDIGDGQAHALSKHGDAGIDGRLGAEQVLDVGLGEHDVAAGRRPYPQPRRRRTRAPPRSARTLGCVRRPAIRPLLSMTPVTNISPRSEIMPEPQMPRGGASPMVR